jgi:hypothetical protein
MNSPKLKCIIASLAALAGFLTFEGAALGEAAVAADEIRGTVNSAHGAEAGVWVTSGLRAAIARRGTRKAAKA